MIDKALGLGHPDPAETYSSSPHFYEELDIPTDADGNGRPRAQGRQDRQARTARRHGSRRGRPRATGNRSRVAAPAAASR